jgi:glucose-1-phosphate cytidylyltransferase
MKVAILAGGRGSRFGSETKSRPKALIDVAGKPILRRVMEIYSAQGFTDFVIALGHRGGDIKRYFFETMWLEGDVVIDMAARSVCSRRADCGNWRITLIDTGTDTATGTRLALLQPHLDEDCFMLTWCDGLADIDLATLSNFHRSHGRIATLTAVNRKGRFGEISIMDDAVTQFVEKPLRRNEWVNGAFFVLDRRIFDHIDGPNVDWEREVLPRLVASEQLMAYRHSGFWQCMDTPQDRDELARLILRKGTRLANYEDQLQ